MLKAIAGTLCGYELTALLTGRVPTLTQMSARHRWLAPVLVTSLAVHLYKVQRPAVSADCLLCPVPLGDLPPAPRP